MFEYLERDLKQYMDDCGGILSMNNVKVRMLSGILFCMQAVDHRQVIAALLRSFLCAAVHLRFYDA